MQKITKRLSIWAMVVAAILSIPLLAKAPWTLMDFIFAGVVLFGAASIFEFVTARLVNKTHRIVVGIVILMTIFLIWVWAVAGP